MHGESLSWRFEVRVHGRAGWLPYDRDLWPIEPRWPDCLGVQRFDDCWDNPLDIATREFDDALSTLAGLGVEIGVVAARIMLWRGESTTGDAAIVLTATDEQMTVGRLRYAVNDVRRAIELVDEARTRLRDQIVAADHAFVGRNQIARETEGAWTRRLVLQFLAGYDLVREFTRMLPHSWERSAPCDAEQPWDHSRHLGPYWCGPVVLELEPAGEVKIGLVDRYRPDQPDLEEASEEELETLATDSRLRIHEHALSVLSTVQRGYQLTTPQGAVAGLEDLVKTSPFQRLLIRRQSSAAASG